MLACLPYVLPFPLSCVLFSVPANFPFLVANQCGIICETVKSCHFFVLCSPRMSQIWTLVQQVL